LLVRKPFKHTRTYDSFLQPHSTPTALLLMLRMKEIRDKPQSKSVGKLNTR